MLPSGAQEKLERGLDALPFAVSAAERAQFVRYLDLLNKWNQVHNLTAVRDAEEQVSRHVLDCLAVLPYIEDAATLADIGSGAGLPALMLAIMRPQLAVTALESNGKKAAFIREAVRVLALANVQVVAQRVEDWQAPPQAVIISRALAAADRVLIITEPGVSSVDGVAELLTTTDTARRLYNPALSLACIVINRWRSDHADRVTWRRTLVAVRLAGPGRA